MKRLIFSDGDGNNLSAYRNTDNRVFIQIENDDVLLVGWITLDSDDLRGFIVELERIEADIILNEVEGEA